MKKFYSYLFSQRFTLITNHRPLLSLLNGQKPTSVHASARIRCWSLALSTFKYNLQFRNTTAHSNADALSHLPLKDTAPMTDTPPELVLLVDHLDSSPITANQIKEATRRDPDLSIVLQYVQKGWQHRSVIEKHLSPFYERQEELTAHDRCLL